MSFPFGVYVHFPFCLAKCGYCDFASQPARRDGIPHARYADAVVRELDGRASGYAPGELRSIYLGGGTPSLWAPREVRRVIDAVVARLGRPADLEVTLEMNPGTLPPGRLDELLEAGVNRVSLGVQSLDDEALRRLGRIHDSAQAREAVRAARAAGTRNLSCDLIAGLPGQRLEGYLAELQQLVELGPDHVSVYALTLSERAPLRLAGHAPAPEELMAEMLEAGAALLERAGLAQYEVSNFAAPGRCSRHNTLCWAGWPYLGLGASAHSMWAEGPCTLRLANPAMPAYLGASLRPGAVPALEGAEADWVDEAGSRLELLFLGLRTLAGVERARYRQRFGADAMDHHGAELRSLEDEGLVRVLPDRIAPTRRGLWLADELAVRLTNGFNTSEGRGRSHGDERTGA